MIQLIPGNTEIDFSQKHNDMKVLWSTIAGWITLFVLSFIIYSFIMPGMFPSLDPAENEFYREEPIFIYFIISHLFLAWVFALIIKNWTDMPSFGSGLRIGFIVSLLLNIGYILEFQGFSYLYPTTGLMIAEILAQVVRLSIMAGIIGLVLGRFGSSEETTTV